MTSTLLIFVVKTITVQSIRYNAFSLFFITLFSFLLWILIFTCDAFYCVLFLFCCLWPRAKWRCIFNFYSCTLGNVTSIFDVVIDSIGIICVSSDVDTEVPLESLIAILFGQALCHVTACVPCAIRWCLSTRASCLQSVLTLYCE